MKGSRQIFSLKRIVSVLFMMATLLWLTVNIPFVYPQQVQKKEAQKQSAQAEDTDFPSTEEKNESKPASVSEYVHDQHLLEYNFIVLTRMYKHYPSKIYYQHHPELLSPPPEV